MSNAQLVSKRTSHWRSGLRGPNPRKRLGRPRLIRRSTLPQSGVAPVICAANATPARYRIHHADQRQSLTVSRAITLGSCIPCPVASQRYGIRPCAREYLGTHTEPVCSRRCLRRRRIGLPCSPVRTVGIRGQPPALRAMWIRHAIGGLVACYTSSAWSLAWTLLPTWTRPLQCAA